MSTNHIENNGTETEKLTPQQQNDEAFINQLYDQVSQEQQIQPSELLDKRIINAAHKAINNSNKPNKKSHVAWYSTLATAASLTLVVSLVVLQQGNILPNEQSVNLQKTDIVLEEGINTTSDLESISPQDVMADHFDYQEKPGYSAISEQVSSSTIEKKQSATNERTLSAMQYKKQSKLVKQKKVAEMMALPPATNKLSAELGITQKEELSITLLSSKKFQQYASSNKTLNIKNQWFWSLLSENDMEYIINISQDKQQSIQYRLDKHRFKVIGVQPSDSEKLLLKNKSLSKILILNTKN